MKYYSYLMYSVVITVIGYGVWIGFEDSEAIIGSLQKIGWTGFSLLCCLSIINYGLRSVRWHYLLKALDDQVPIIDGTICYLSGFALTATPGKAGEILRCVYLKKRHAVSHAHAISAMLSERVSDAITGVILSLLAIYSFQEYAWLCGVLLVGLIGIIYWINNPRYIFRFVSMLRFIKNSFFQRLLDGISIFIERSVTLLGLKPIAMGTMLGILSWFSSGLGFAWVAQTLGGDASFILYVGIFAAGMIAGAISFIPGGLGSTEAVLFVLLAATGLGSVEALTAILLCRLATLWFSVILGLLAIVILENSPHQYS